MKKIKTLGIIGGLGPETTTRFYMEIVFMFSKVSKRRPNIIISNVSLPLKVEEEIIKEAKNERNVLPFLIDAAKQLERGGADFIVIPCNTVHLFIKDIRKSVKIPILSIIDETSLFLKKKKIKEIGILATSSTIKNKLFDENLKNSGINIKIPDGSDQLTLGTIINNIVNNKHGKKDKNKLLKIIRKLNERNVVLACTDLQILNPKRDGTKIFDTMHILAEAAVKEQLR